mgnify:CR=1 FL=1
MKKIRNPFIFDKLKYVILIIMGLLILSNFSTFYFWYTIDNVPLYPPMIMPISSLMILLVITSILIITFRSYQLNFIKNKRRYILIGILGGLIYSVIGSIIVLYFVMQGKEQINSYLASSLMLFIFLPFLSIFSPLGAYFGFLIIILQPLFGFYFATWIYYQIKKIKAKKDG